MTSYYYKVARGVLEFYAFIGSNRVRVTVSVSGSCWGTVRARRRGIV